MWDHPADHCITVLPSVYAGDRLLCIIQNTNHSACVTARDCEMKCMTQQNCAIVWESPQARSTIAVGHRVKSEWLTLLLSNIVMDRLTGKVGMESLWNVLYIILNKIEGNSVWGKRVQDNQTRWRLALEWKNENPIVQRWKKNYAYVVVIANKIFR